MKNDNPKIFLITDTHWGHDNIIKYCNRPLNYNDLIIERWKEIVSEKDIIYHLGDVIMGRHETLTNILSQLPGTKILIKGNHDNHSDNWYIRAGFDAVLEKAQVNGVILSHKPSFLSELEINYGIINVFGHFHNAPADRWEFSLKERIIDSHYLLSIEKVNYYPVLLEDVKNKKFVLNAKKEINNIDKKI